MTDLRKILLSVSASLILCSGAAVLTAEGQTEVLYEGDLFNPETIPLVREQMKPLPLISGEYKQETLDYFRHYGADGIPGTIRFGTVQTGELKIAAYIFEPPAGSPSKGTVYLLHGYLDHTLSNTEMIKSLVKEYYTVAAIDLPGHGFSEGPSVEIGDFSEYASAFRGFFSYTEETMPRPFYGLGHSTGCSVIMEYLNTYSNDFEQIVLVSPLVKTLGWQLTPLGLALTRNFQDRVGRRFGGSCSNSEYEYFVEYHDPLQSRTVPYTWIYASMNWDDRMELMTPREDLVFHILQGRKDSVVDFRYNIPFLLEKYPRSDVKYYTDGEHSLFNEVPSIRDQVFEDVLNLLQPPAGPARSDLSTVSVPGVDSPIF